MRLKGVRYVKNLISLVFISFLIKIYMSFTTATAYYSDESETYSNEDILLGQNAKIEINTKFSPDAVLQELHPLDPLTPEEVTKTSQIIKAKFPQQNWMFMGILLNEPPKSILYPFLVHENNGVKLPFLSSAIISYRKSFTVLYDFKTREIHEAVVNLNTDEVERLTKMKTGTIPNYQGELKTKWSAIVMNDTRVQERINKLGFELGSIIPSVSGYFPFDKRFSPNNLYLHQFTFYATNFYNDNYYAHPLDFSLVFDINEEKILSIINNPVHDQFTPRDNNEGVTVPRRSSNYDPNLPGFQPGSLRKDVKPLELKFPKGPSYTVEGNSISWQKFKFRIGFNYREGLTLHNVVYKDEGKVRPLFYRLSISELSVSYADPRSPYHRKQVLDEIWYGLGNTANSLVHSEDCIGATAFFNGTIIKTDGSFQLIPNAICVSEGDDGILWKHRNEFTGKINIARSRRLTVTQISTISNYEYAFLWHFYQDATIRFEIKATGIVLTRLLAKGASPFGFGTTVFPQISASYHQHVYAVRIDPMIDGQKNTISTIDVVPVVSKTGSPTNPYGNGFTTREKVLKSAGEARTNISPSTARVWKISNNERIHPYTKEPMGYKLMAENLPPLLMKKNSPIRQLMKYAEHSVYVTPYQDYRHFIAGFYVDQNGINEWVDKNEEADVENEDVVLWHTFTNLHIPNVEDFPVMPQGKTGFMVKPYNFFLGNPAVDVP